MDTVDYTAIYAVWYLLAGGFKLYSDFSPPTYKRPIYAIQGKTGTALLVFFLWPVIGVQLLMLEKRFTGKPILRKFFFNFFMLIVLFLWVRLAYLVAGKVTETKLVQFLLTFPITWVFAWALWKIIPQRS